MRQVAVYRNGHLAGILTEESRRAYCFTYDDAYFHDPNQAAISLTLPKSQQTYRSTFLFPFFFNLLSEGVNRKLQSAQWRIDEDDDFGLLMATAQYDTIGPITIKPIAP
ncbi:MAG: HipA N-terminal domain-containing protein [Chitinophagaceae bacterium]